MLRRTLCALLACLMLAGVPVCAALAPEISSPSVLLMEKETGTVIYEKEAHERLAPASVTKVMTILLIVEAIEEGRLSLGDTVTASAAAVSKGGSQIYLEEGERMSLEEMLKAVIVSSANDCAAALAEHLAGSEEAFVALMNERAAELGMEDTVFANCTGLPCESEHLSSAHDIAVMSRELIRHEMVKDYTTIWMDSVRNGEFGLSNTNKLVRYYTGTTGLKTGFTDEAMYCLSATAERDGIEYIAVVMHDASSDGRFASARALLDFAFANYTLTQLCADSPLPTVPVTLGEYSEVQAELDGGGRILVEKAQLSSMEKTLCLEESLEAPVKAGQVIGELTMTSDGEVLCTAPIVAAEDVDRLSWSMVFVRILRLLATGKR